MSPAGAPSHDGELVFCGSYTNFACLPHWPYSNTEGEGIYVGKFKEGRLERVGTVPILNPAFMK